MRCRLCQRRAETLICLRCYTTEGIMVCPECWHVVDQHRHKPYSSVMERLALAEAGYRINRKKARR